MYEILNNQKRMTREEIREEFQGKWVFLVDLDSASPFERFETAVPAVVADKLFEGSETGIYKELNERYNNNTTDMTFLNNLINVFGFTEVMGDDE